MENIMETIIAYIQAQDLYTVISLGVLFTLVFVIVIYKKSQKPTTKYLEDIQEDKIYEDDIFDNVSDDNFDDNSDDDKYETFPQEKTLHDTPRQANEGGSRMIWFIIDGVAILTFTAISYILFLKNLWRDEYFLKIIVKSIGANIVFYYAFIKPTLFNTKPKK